MSDGCTGLQQYIRKSHKNLYDALEDDCAVGLLGARKAEYPRGAIIPSKEGFAALKKLNSPEKRLEFLKAYCLVTAWTPDELKVSGRYLVTRNHKRLPVKSASGKKVELANGTVLELSHSAKPKIVVYKVVKGLVSEGEPSERADLGIPAKQGGGMKAKGHERSVILNSVVNAAVGQTLDSSSSTAGIKELVGLLHYASSTEDKALGQRVASTFGYMPLTESFIVFGSREVVPDSILSGFLEFMESKFALSPSEIVQAYLEVITRGDMKICAKRRDLVRGICRKDGLSDPSGLISMMSKAYDTLDRTNTIGGLTVFKDGAAAMHKKHPGWMKWADDFRFRWFTVLREISLGSSGEKANNEYQEAFGCMQLELLHKRCGLLNKSKLAHKTIAATHAMLLSDVFLFMPLSQHILSSCGAVSIDDVSPTKLAFNSLLSEGAKFFVANSMRRGGGMSAEDIKLTFAGSKDSY